jgi:hypothetical protein
MRQAAIRPPRYLHFVLYMVSRSLFVTAERAPHPGVRA